MKRTVTLLSALVYAATCLQAQRKIVFEQLRYAMPFDYFAEPTMQQSIGTHLAELIRKHHLAQLTDSTRLPLVSLNERSNAGSEKFDFSRGDTGTWHLLVEVAEYMPASYYAAMNTPAANAADSVQRAKTKTVFRFTTAVVNGRNEIIYSNLVDILVFHTRGPGMGAESIHLFVMPKTFLEIARKALSELMDPQSDKDKIGLGVAPVFAADNFYMPRLAGRARYFVTDNGQSFQFIYDTTHLLRKSEPLYEELQLKGKRAMPYPRNILDAIQKADNRSGSDFVFLKQEWRDVLRDRNYLVQLLIQVNPEKNYGIPEQALTGFMPGNLHFLLEEKDTVARFSITKYITDGDKKIYPGRVYNGVDTAAMVSIGMAETVWPLKYNYVVQGSIAKRSFEIRCSGAANTMKELYLDGELVCIAQGRFAPELFVVFDASLSYETLKQLFIIGFNRFFE
ncbi:hypothetical protein [Sediminibacterium soli]|uniref:hypothetical protein n=1 Tax=Sediminibacterium soli TaxID=2698829 RepID=UPI0013799C89|nr:hypothetical protein [Sediminibacterium soli]NCI47735.1 hypothetical protein [Sediminibacterium soli]